MYNIDTMNSLVFFFANQPSLKSIVPLTKLQLILYVSLFHFSLFFAISVYDVLYFINISINVNILLVCLL